MGLANNKNVLNEKVYPKIKTSLSKPTSSNEIKKFFSYYLNKNNSKLSDIGPMENIFFTKEYQATLFEIMGVTEAEVKQAMVESTDILVKSGDQTVKPFNLAMGVAIKVLDELKRDKDKEMMVFLMFMSFFPSTFNKYFKFNPNREVMTYVINNMSNRFDIKKKGYFNTLRDMASGSYRNIEERLRKSNDSIYVYFSCDMRNRQNSFFKNVRDEFEQAHKSGKYLNSTEDSFDPEDFHISDSDTVLVRNLVNSSIMKFRSGAPNQMLISFAAKICTVSVNELRNIVLRIQRSATTPELQKLMEAILNEFVFVKKQRYAMIHSNVFLTYNLQLFKSNSSKEESNIKIIKDSLQLFIEKYTDVMINTSREATINNWRRAIFVFFVLMLQQNA